VIRAVPLERHSISAPMNTVTGTRCSGPRQSTFMILPYSARIARYYGQSSTSTNSNFEVIYEDARRASVTIPGEPEVNSLETAKSSKYWPLIKEEIEGEIRGKLENEAFEAVSVFDDHGNRRRIMKTKWVITISFNADGTLRKIKCRVCGVWLFANRGQIFQGHLCVNAVRGFVPPMGVDRQ